MTYKPFCDGCDTVIEGYVIRLQINATGSGCLASNFYSGKTVDLHEGCISRWLLSLAVLP